MKRLDLIGSRFGRLLVKKLIKPKRRYGRRYRRWLCLCDCGKVKIVFTEDLRSGQVKSCGCLHIECVRINGKKNLKYPPKFDKLAWQRNHRKANRQQYTDYLKNSLARMKDVAFTKLGDHCSSSACSWVNEDGSKGCTDRRCLQIDHINGGGRKDRNSGAGRYGLYKRILEGSRDYQILCANCNWIKLVVNKEWKGPQIVISVNSKDQS